MPLEMQLVLNEVSLYFVLLNEIYLQLDLGLSLLDDVLLCNLLRNNLFKWNHKKHVGSFLSHRCFELLIWEFLSFELGYFPIGPRPS